MRGALLAAVTAAGLLAGASGRARAQTPTEPIITAITFWTGQDMLNYCTGDDAHARDACLGFAMGIADAASVASLRGGHIGDVRICRPIEVSGSKVRDVVVQYLQAHPELGHYGAAGLAIEALADAWPCP